jgi:UPF0042 nucleotide-binding protein
VDVTDQRLIIITGLSGSGKSTAMAALEDVGYVCIDNMPIALLPRFLELPCAGDPDAAGVALGMDMRDPRFVAESDAVLTDLRQRGVRFEIVFLEAEEAVLARRYSATRRQHPLAKGRGLAKGIEEEKRRLEPLRAAADHIIETSRLTVHELKARITAVADAGRTPTPMQINVISFGFKYGIPAEADLLVDVRFLANPFFVAELKALDGENPAVRDYVLTSPEANAFIARYNELTDFLIPLYEREGKANLNIAVGCTGGRHRSVTLARIFYDRLAAVRQRVELIHRDIQQPQSA